ncbi:MAG: TolB family protein [Calditrichia bacterium]
MFDRILNINLICFTLFLLACSQPSEVTRPEFKFPLIIKEISTNETRLLQDSQNRGFDSSILFFGKNDSSIISANGRFILQIPTDFSAIRTLYIIPTDLGDINSNVSVSPDKRFLAFSLKPKDPDILWEIYLLDLSSLNLKQITNSANTIYQYPSFSPDSEYLVFSGERKDVNLETLEIVNLATMKTDTVLTSQGVQSTSRRYRYPHFSDTGRIVYLGKSSAGAFTDSILSIDIFGNDKQILDTECCFVNPVYVSQNGERIVYTKEGSPDLLVSMRSDGTDYVELMNGFNFGGGDGFSISPDGSKILYWSGKNRTLHSMDNNGQNQQVIAVGKNAIISCDLSLIAFASIREK